MEEKIYEATSYPVHGYGELDPSCQFYLASPEVVDAVCTHAERLIRDPDGRIGEEVGQSELVLDLGCGTGRLMGIFHHRTGIPVVGVEKQSPLALRAEQLRDRRDLNTRGLAIINSEISHAMFGNQKIKLVMMNPPFGSGIHKHADRAFHNLAAQAENVVLVCKGPHCDGREERVKPGLIRFYENRNFKLHSFEPVNQVIHRTYKQHTRGKVTVPVWVLSFKKL